ncbi:MAG: ABC transporter ATP-binding protein [Deltaproteobacteria bacterium]|jgi:putative ABC transport system ATP-binding protein|nr:ABC transporter ATP-binding protein [Deltaproteobacteria bacterium]MBW2491467.1 ABC transporter ATP-binding protein [Deltaproteobacteria bacterium]
MVYILADNLTKTFGEGEIMVKAIDGISFQIEEGEFVAVMGESGAGKSTLLGMMGAMNAPTSGSLMVDDIDIYRLTQEQRADFRREFLGFVFQSFHLVPYLTVMENIMLPLAIIKRSKKNKQEMAEAAMNQVGLSGKAHRLPNQISGGEKERVAVARAIVNEPPVLLADEPTGNLDTKTSQDIMELLLRLNDNGMTIVMVTHSPDCAGYARRIMRLADGKLMDDNIKLRSLKRWQKKRNKEPFPSLNQALAAGSLPTG